jgi:hypothetical protein
MKRMKDKEIAAEFIRLVDEHEKSWNGTEYTLGRHAGLYVRQHLNSDNSGFATMLREFCVLACGDCYEIAKRFV